MMMRNATRQDLKRVSHKHQFAPESNSYRGSELIGFTPALPAFTSKIQAGKQTNLYPEEDVP